MNEPQELEQIESALRATDAVRSVVQAVWALARAQLPRVEEAVTHSSEYLDWVDAVVDRVAGPPRPSALESSLTVVLGPERAFCGSLAQAVLERAPASGPLGLVGARLSEVAARQPAFGARVRFELPGPSSVDDLGEVSAALARALLAHGEDAPVDVLYPRGARSGMRRAVLLASEREAGRPDFEHYSPLSAVLAAAVRESVTGRLRIALAESLMAETRARVTAAERAKRAADERQRSLESRLRVQQQEGITRELVELTAGLLAT
ncbi:MAG TPA: F0F1 ATP synthase subunit gamma [Sandaracinaceae bacterium LLY-WYZ-13_1]|nr:F0F1 ATP synthase subunit gamma [Sandaracinaceae bacterium LLY-WYZ-13_1]